MLHDPAWPPYFDWVDDFSRSQTEVRCRHIHPCRVNLPDLRERPRYDGDPRTVTIQIARRSLEIEVDPAVRTGTRISQQSSLEGNISSERRGRRIDIKKPVIIVVADRRRMISLLTAQDTPDKV